jgi:hypothetical protein
MSKVPSTRGGSEAARQSRVSTSTSGFRRSTLERGETAHAAARSFPAVRPSSAGSFRVDGGGAQPRRGLASRPRGALRALCRRGCSCRRQGSLSALLFRERPGPQGLSEPAEVRGRHHRLDWGPAVRWSDGDRRRHVWRDREHIPRAQDRTRLGSRRASRDPRARGRGAGQRPSRFRQGRPLSVHEGAARTARQRLPR